MTVEEAKMETARKIDVLAAQCEADADSHKAGGRHFLSSMARDEAGTMRMVAKLIRVGVL